MKLNLAELSPAAWVAIMKAKWHTLSDADLFKAIGEECIRRQSLRSSESAPNHLVNIWHDLGITLRRPYQLICKCGEAHNIK